MNGRVYDPQTGRFVSADPTLQYPYNPQDLNRYSYVINNPLSLTDPSGFGFLDFVAGLFKSPQHTLKALFEGAGRDARRVVRQAGQFIHTYWRPIVAAVLAYYTGGLAANLFADGSWEAAVVGGTVGGGVYGASSTALNGGSVEDVLRSAVIGGAYGAAGGAINFGVGSYLDKGYTASFTSGAANGFAQTGTLRGALLGGASGMVPYDLGASGAYNSSPLANMAIREGVALIRGSIINGSLQGGLDEAMYVAETEAAGFAFGYVSELIVAGGNANEVMAPHFNKGAWVFSGGFSGGWATIGNVISGPSFNDYLYGDNYLRHELGHANWQSALGRNYLSITGLSAFIGSTTNAILGYGFTSSSPAYGAITEHAPFHPYGYGCLPNACH